MREDQEARYTEVVATFGDALERLARAFEVDAERRRDLLREMHVALWRSLAIYDDCCFLRTWVYRVAHNVTASYIDRERRGRQPTVPLEDIENLPSGADTQANFEERDALDRLRTLVRKLKSPDCQIMALYLDGVDAALIAEITGLSCLMNSMPCKGFGSASQTRKSLPCPSMTFVHATKCFSQGSQGAILLNM